MDVTLRVQQGARTQTLRLKRSDTIVGRRQGCDVRIPSSRVSRRHCRVFVRDGYVEVEDLASANGTFVNGEQINGSRPLRPGDKLAVGPLVFVVDYSLTVEAEERLERRFAGEAPITAEVVEEDKPVTAEVVEEDLVPVDAVEIEPGEPDAVEPEREQRTVSTPPPRVQPKPPHKKKKGKVAPAPKEDEDETVEQAQGKQGAESEDSPDVSAVMNRHGPWTPDGGDDLRDILAQIEEEADE